MFYKYPIQIHSINFIITRVGRSICLYIFFQTFKKYISCVFGWIFVVFGDEGFPSSKRHVVWNNSLIGEFVSYLCVLG